MDFNDLLPGEVMKTQDEIDQHTDRLEALEHRLANIEANTDEIVAFFASAKGAFEVLSWLGKIAKWVAAIATACAILWALFKSSVMAAR